MSQPFDNDFNNNSQNSFASDNQNINNPEAELQQTAEDNAVEMESDNIENNDQEQSPDEEKRPEDKERSDEADADVNPSENQPETAPEETSSNAGASDNDVGEPDIPDNPVDNFPKETASNGANVNNCNTEAASDQSTSDVSNNNNKKFEEKIQKKIDAVKEFAFCQKKVSFPFFKEKYNDIPIYPYVAALTGHRDALITDTVRETAKKQLRSLAQSWDNACKGRSWLILPKKTAPLIALIGLGDGESGKMWAEIAAELRDNEKYNIKIVAVASMPLKDMVNILSKHTSFLSDKKDFLDAKNSFDYILEKADGLIELPYEQDVKEYIKLYENLEMNCTGDNAAHSDDIFKILFKESKAFQDIQYKEYRKFMCVHSHVLLALTENATNWESANLAGIDINELNNDAFDKAISKDSLLIPYKEKDDARKALKELNNQITELKNRGSKTEKFEDLIGSFETLAGSLFRKITESIPRTNAMIFYKLLGNVDSALIRAKHKVNGISFTSIGPVVCIHTKHKTPDPEAGNTQNSSAAVTILIKDQPNDTNAKLIYDIPWNDKDISQFYEISDVIAECGKINKKLFNKPYYSHEEDIQEKDVIKDFLKTQSKNEQINIEKISIDKATLSLVKHHNSAKKLSKHYYRLMKIWTLIFAGVAFILFSSLGIGTVLNKDDVITFSNYGIAILTFALIGFYSLFKVHQYYHYFEALASGLKVQILWNMAEVNEDVPGQFYLHQISSITWLRVAFNGLLTTASSTPVNYNEVNESRLDNFKFIKAYWIDSSLKQIAGKTDYKLTETILNKIEGFSDLIPGPNLLKQFILPIWQAGAYIAGASYLALLPFIRHNALSGSSISSFLEWVKVIVYSALFVLLSLIVVYKAYRKSSLKKLDIKRRRQLLYPYRRAQLLYGIKIKYWDKSPKSLLGTEALQNDKNEENSDWKVINYSYQECQKILEDLGRIELAINAEWLLGLKDRELNLSGAKKEIQLKSYEYKDKNKEKED